MLDLFTGTDPQESGGWSSLNASGGDVGAGWSLRGTSSSRLYRVDADTRRARESPKVKVAIDRSMPRSPLPRRPSMGQLAKCCKEIWYVPPVLSAAHVNRFGGDQSNSHDNRRTLTRTNSAVKTVGFTVKTRLTRIPMGSQTLSTMSVSSVLGSLLELGNL
jgi:hypothetical protein